MARVFDAEGKMRFGACEWCGRALPSRDRFSCRCRRPPETHRSTPQAVSDGGSSPRERAMTSSGSAARSRSRSTTTQRPRPRPPVAGRSDVAAGGATPQRGGLSGPSRAVSESQPSNNGGLLLPPDWQEPFHMPEAEPQPTPLFLMPTTVETAPVRSPAAFPTPARTTPACERGGLAGNRVSTGRRARRQAATGPARSRVRDAFGRFARTTSVVAKEEASSNGRIATGTPGGHVPSSASSATAPGGGSAVVPPATYRVGYQGAPGDAAPVVWLGCLVAGALAATVVMMMVVRLITGVGHMVGNAWDTLVGPGRAPAVQAAPQRKEATGGQAPVHVSQSHTRPRMPRPAKPESKGQSRPRANGATSNGWHDLREPAAPQTHSSSPSDAPVTEGSAFQAEAPAAHLIEPRGPKPVGGITFPQVVRAFLAPYRGRAVTATVEVDASGKARVRSVDSEVALSRFLIARIEQAVLAVRWEPARDRFDAPVSGVVRLVIRVE